GLAVRHRTLAPFGGITRIRFKGFRLGRLSLAAPPLFRSRIELSDAKSMGRGSKPDSPRQSEATRAVATALRRRATNKNVSRSSSGRASKHCLCPSGSGAEPDGERPNETERVCLKSTIGDRR